MNINRCPSCLKPSDNEFCLSCRKNLFKGKAVSYILPFTQPEYNQRKREGVGRLSISGVQSKYSLKLNGTKLEMTEAGGEYILKPYVQGELEDMHDMPANEHVTMQIARQVFDLDVASSALLYFADGETPAYLTKRFDLLEDGTKQSREDFAQIAQMSEESDGNNFKYESSYQEIGKHRFDPSNNA